MKFELLKEVEVEATLGQAQLVAIPNTSGDLVAYVPLSAFQRQAQRECLLVLRDSGVELMVNGIGIAVFHFEPPYQHF